MWVHALLALLPVLLFLTALQLTDSFRLVRPARLAVAMVAGASAALLALTIQQGLGEAAPLSRTALVRYVGPLTEEALKAVPLVIWIARGRVGFLVDAALLGFAVGAGFAVVENTIFLTAFAGAPTALWLVRGLGTAVMHGATTSILAIVTKTLADRRPERWPIAGGSGWAVAFAFHSAFNHLLLPPMAASALLLAVLPPLVVWVFERSERATREWIGAGLDLDVQLLELMRSDQFQHTRFAAYLGRLREHFPASVLIDMTQLLKLELELAIQAKAWLVAHEAGLQLPVDADTRAALAARAALRGSIGRAGLRALEPLRPTSYRDDWHRHILAQAGTTTRSART